MSIVRLPSDSPIPLYHQLFTVLRQRIVDGLYAKEQQLPTEDDLAREFSVSRATIRQAVGELVKIGMLARKQGRGTFVISAEPHAVGQRFRGSLSDLMKETSRTRVDDLEIERQTRIPDRIQELLRLPKPVGTVIRRTRLMDDRVFAFTVNFLPEEYGRLIKERDLRVSSLMHTLEQRGVRLKGAVQSIHAQVADIALSQRLRVDFGAPVLFVERVIHGTNRRPIELVQSWYRGDIYEYTVTLDLGKAGRDGKHLA